jgi:AcrR family transcriptional regulator
MLDNEAKTRLGRNDWVLAGMRALVRGGIPAVKVELLAREIKTTKGSFYWHFKDLADLHRAMLDLWETLATNAATAAVRASGLAPRAQLALLVDMVALQPGEAFGGAGIEVALRAWGRSDPMAQAAVKRVDSQRLADLSDFLAAAGVPNAELALKADLIYAAVIGLESLRLTTGAEIGSRLGALVAELVDQEKA